MRLFIEDYKLNSENYFLASGLIVIDKQLYFLWMYDENVEFALSLGQISMYKILEDYYFSKLFEIGEKIRKNFIENNIKEIVLISSKSQNQVNIVSPPTDWYELFILSYDNWVKKEGEYMKRYFRLRAEEIKRNSNYCNINNKHMHKYKHKCKKIHNISHLHKFQIIIVTNNYPSKKKKNEIIIL